jgi:hypothetical protein
MRHDANVPPKIVSNKGHTDLKQKLKNAGHQTKYNLQICFIWIANNFLPGFIYLYLRWSSLI